MNLLGSIINGVTGAATGFLAGGTVGAAAGGMNGVINGGGGPAGGFGTINPGSDLTIGGSQFADKAFEYNNFMMQIEQLRHQSALQAQSQQFNEVQDEKSEQMREMNTLRTVAMKQREADDKIVKEFIKTAGGE
jgi:hypothetical protein